ncbi:hypothetical protein UY3_08131 [Chelonia mydas]|uniref:Uncharacterized protein n=1 Tax=Chelonia mydas TaxID=8469 RepID=M7BRJ0_CHEMY|nr:hypothetical protein UY3_08131 [Chelonia mydas]
MAERSLVDPSTPPGTRRVRVATPLPPEGDKAAPERAAARKAGLIGKAATAVVSLIRAQLALIRGQWARSLDIPSLALEKEGLG